MANFSGYRVPAGTPRMLTETSKQGFLVGKSVLKAETTRWWMEGLSETDENWKRWTGVGSTPPPPPIGHSMVAGSVSVLRKLTVLI